jgi:hypothetical protein
VQTAPPLRILHLYPKADYFTGGAIQMLELATGLADRGHHVVVATRPSDVWTRKAAERMLRHYPLPMTSFADLRSVWALARIMRVHRIQVVHAHKGRACWLAVAASLLARLPVLVANRGVSFRVIAAKIICQ